MVLSNYTKGFKLVFQHEQNKLTEEIDSDALTLFSTRILYEKFDNLEIILCFYLFA